MDPKDCRDVESQVRYIADLMARGDWHKSRQFELSAVWGIEPNTVRRRASEAHRLFAINEDERAQYRAALATMFRKIAEQALASSNVITGLPDFRNALAALDLYGRYSSLDTEPSNTSEQRPTRIVIEQHGPPGQVQPPAIPDAPESAAK